jgi:hypothetical protein
MSEIKPGPNNPVHLPDPLPVWATCAPEGDLATPAGYFEAAWSRFLVAQGSTWRRDFLVGGTHVTLEGKGEALAEALTPALAHLAVTDVHVGAPRLIVRTWDSIHGRVDPPPLPALPGDKLAHDRVSRLSDDRFTAVLERHFGALTLLDGASGRGIYYTHDGVTLPYYETAAPMRALWYAWFSRHAALPLHGACVGRGDDVLLLTAPGGNGKSTTALLALQAGFEYLADDWCLIAPRVPAAYSLFSSAKLRPDNLHRFPGLADRIHNHDRLDEEKATFFLHRYFPSQLKSSGRLRALVIPRVGGTADTSFAKVSAALAFHALMQVTLQGMAGAGKELFPLLGEVARCAPVYQLTLGHDLAQIPPALDAILAHASRA